MPGPSAAGARGGPAPSALLPCPSSDAVTVLRAASTCWATKVHTWKDEAWTTRPYRAGKWFEAHGYPLNGIHDLSALLHRLEPRPRRFIVRGALTGDRTHAPRVRRRSRKHHPQADFERADRRFVCLDLDDAPAPPGLDPHDPDSLSRAVRWAILTYLPSCFHGVTAHYQWSASAGVKGWDVLRLHLWFWLSRPACDDALKPWIRSHGHYCDDALFTPVQPHYTAAPLFFGAPDPLQGRRSGLLRGERDAVDLPPIIVDLQTLRAGEVAAQAERESARYRRHHAIRRGTLTLPSPEGSSAQAHAALDEACEDIRGAVPGRRHLTLRAASYRVGTWVQAGLLPFDEAERRLAAAAQTIFTPSEWALEAPTLRGGLAKAPPLDRTTLAYNKAATLPASGPPDDAKTQRDREVARQNEAIQNWFEQATRAPRARQEVKRRRQQAHQQAGVADRRSRDEPEADSRRRLKATLTRRGYREVAREFGYKKLPRKPQGPRLLITGPQGSGKSTQAAKGIAALPNSLVIYWLVPTLAKAEEQRDEYNKLGGPHSPQAFVVRGRTARDPGGAHPLMCPRAKVVNRASGLGVNVTQRICPHCPLRKECGYLRQAQQIADTPQGLFIMTHPYAFLPCPAPNPDLVIVDESPLNYAVRHDEFSRDKITALRVPSSMGHQNPDLYDTLRKIHAALRHHPQHELATLRHEGVTRQHLQDAQAALNQALRHQVLPFVSGQCDDQELGELLDTCEQTDAPRIVRLLHQLEQEWDTGREGLHSVTCDPSSGQVEVHSLMELRYSANTPLLALDGTGNLWINRKIFGDRMKEQRFAVPRDAEVLQVRGKTFSRQSLTGRDPHGRPRSPQARREADRLRADILQMIRQLDGPTFVAAPQVVEQALLEEGLGQHAETAHFGNLRGVNRFQHCENAVIIGREQPPPGDIEEITRAFTAQDREPLLTTEKYVEETRQRRMRDRSLQFERVQVHPDPRCQAILEQIREAEIVQAVDRVRPVYNPRNIWILTHVVCDICVDHALRWGEVVGGGPKLARALETSESRGVLPLSASWLARHLPDIFPSPRTAKRAIQVLGEPGRVPVVHRNSRWTRARYGLGGRGRSFHVLIRDGTPDPHAALEALLGRPVAWVRRGHP